MARKNEELLRKLSALKPSLPTRTRNSQTAKKGKKQPETGKEAAKSGRAAVVRPTKRAAAKKMERPVAAGAAEASAPVPGKADARRMEVPEKAVPGPGRPVKAKQPAPASEREGSTPATGTPPTAGGWDSWKVGFFSTLPGAGCGAFGDAPGAACREAARLQQFWMDGWLRYARLLMDVVDLQMKVILGLGRPWSGGR
jgi:hypothetical protein